MPNPPTAGPNVTTRPTAVQAERVRDGGGHKTRHEPDRPAEHSVLQGFVGRNRPPPHDQLLADEKREPREDERLLDPRRPCNPVDEQRHRDREEDDPEVDEYGDRPDIHRERNHRLGGHRPAE